MKLTRYFKYLGTALGGVLLLLLLSLAVYAYKALPQWSGESKLTGLGAKVKIQRDSADVTHILAASSLDAWRSLGYVHAKDRSWQLEFNRRVMHGQLSEILGATTLETDKLMRTLGIIQAARAQFANYPANVKAALEAYVAGINAFHSDAGQALPPEFHLFGIKPTPWQASDSVGWALIMAMDLGGNWGTEFARFSSLQKLNTQELWQMMPPYEGEQPATKVDLANLYRGLGVYASTATLQSHTHTPAAHFAHLGNDINDWAASIGHVDSRGSNNWVVAGRKTASGKPLLANDPHLGLSAPAIWYFARLQSPDIDVIGATLPGAPFVVLGRTQTAAWGFTNTGPDVQDLFLEQINPQNPAQYRLPGDHWASFTTRQEIIKVKGQGDVTYTARSTRHGPVISDAQKIYEPVLNKSRYAMALRWAALDADNLTWVAALQANQAKTVADLTQAFSSHHSPMQNIVMADLQGAVGYKAAGRVPIRAANNGLRGIAPALGWDAAYDWTGWLPYSQTPEQSQAQIEKTGWHATANERIHAADYAHFMGQDWGVPYRKMRIDTMLAATDKHSMSTMAAVQADTLSLASQKILPVLLQSVQSDHPMAKAVLTQLKVFDHRMTKDSAAATVLNTWIDELARAMLADKLGSEKFKSLYGKRQFRQGIEELLAANQGLGHKAWCAPQSCSERYTAAFDITLNKLGDRYGKDLSLWIWGKVHPALSSHRPLSSVPVLKNLFTVEVPSSGDPFTVNVGQYHLDQIDRPFANRHAASLRALYDLSNLENSQFIYQTGQSGLVFSSRYRDMANEWADVQYRPMQLNPASFLSTMILLPAP